MTTDFSVQGSYDGFKMNPPKQSNWIFHPCTQYPHSTNRKGSDMQPTTIWNKNYGYLVKKGKQNKGEWN